MKRDAVFRALDPFMKLDIEVDIVQLTPLVLYNFLFFDQMGELPPPEEYDPENPPESVVIISLGTDATDLVITNGFRVWQRSIPMGGSHFTKALIRELKLTFAKAEHLKRNATAAADPKAVFQAMRPVFSDLLTELAALDRLLLESRPGGEDRPGGGAGQRHETARPAPLPLAKPGLRDREDRVVPRAGPARRSSRSPTFQENLLSFPVCYGLALQGLGKGRSTPTCCRREIIRDRLVKRKKPWAVAAAALLLLGCGISFAAYSLALGGVNDPAWQPAQSAGQAT